MKAKSIVVSETDRWPNPWNVKDDSVLVDLSLVYERLGDVFRDLASGGGRQWSVDNDGVRRQTIAFFLPSDDELRLVREEGKAAPGFVRDAVPLSDLARRLCWVAERAGIEKRRARGLVRRLALDGLSVCAEYRGRITGALELSLARDVGAAQVAEAEAQVEEAKAKMHNALGKHEAEAEARAREAEKREEAEEARRNAEIKLARFEERKAKRKKGRGDSIPQDVKKVVLEFVEMECGGDVRGEGGWEGVFDRFVKSSQYTTSIKQHVGSPAAMERIANAARTEQRRRQKK